MDDLEMNNCKNYDFLDYELCEENSFLYDLEENP